MLIEGKSAKKIRGVFNEYYWHIYLGTVRVGRVLINRVEIGPFAPHASITVELNKASRGQGIGTIVFHRACELSRYNEVYASIRKGNIASRIAAERAGFKPVENWKGRELYMIWRRNTQQPENAEIDT